MFFDNLCHPSPPPSCLLSEKVSRICIHELVRKSLFIFCWPLSKYSRVEGFEFRARPSVGSFERHQNRVWLSELHFRANNREMTFVTSVECFDFIGNTDGPAELFITRILISNSPADFRNSDDIPFLDATYSSFVVPVWPCDLEIVNSLSVLPVLTVFVAKLRSYLLHRAVACKCGGGVKEVHSKNAAWNIVKNFSWNLKIQNRFPVFKFCQLTIIRICRLLFFLNKLEVGICRVLIFQMIWGWQTPLYLHQTLVITLCYNAWMWRMYIEVFGKKKRCRTNSN